MEEMWFYVPISENELLRGPCSPGSWSKPGDHSWAGLEGPPLHRAPISETSAGSETEHSPNQGRGPRILHLSSLWHKDQMAFAQEVILRNNC